AFREFPAGSCRRGGRDTGRVRRMIAKSDGVTASKTQNHPNQQREDERPDGGSRSIEDRQILRGREELAAFGWFDGVRCRSGGHDRHRRSRWRVLLDERWRGLVDERWRGLLNHRRRVLDGRYWLLDDR